MTLRSEHGHIETDAVLGSGDLQRYGGSRLPESGEIQRYDVEAAVIIMADKVGTLPLTIGYPCGEVVNLAVFPLHRNRSGGRQQAELTIADKDHSHIPLLVHNGKEIGIVTGGSITDKRIFVVMNRLAVERTPVPEKGNIQRLTSQTVNGNVVNRFPMLIHRSEDNQVIRSYSIYVRTRKRMGNRLGVQGLYLTGRQELYAVIRVSVAGDVNLTAVQFQGRTEHPLLL